MAWRRRILQLMHGAGLISVLLFPNFLVLPVSLHTRRDHLFISPFSICHSFQKSPFPSSLAQWSLEYFQLLFSDQPFLVILPLIQAYATLFITSYSMKRRFISTPGQRPRRFEQLLHARLQSVPVIIILYPPLFCFENASFYHTFLFVVFTHHWRFCSIRMCY